MWRYVALITILKRNVKLLSHRRMVWMMHIPINLLLSLVSTDLTKEMANLVRNFARPFLIVSVIAALSSGS